MTTGSIYKTEGLTTASTLTRIKPGLVLALVVARAGYAKRWRRQGAGQRSAARAQIYKK